MDIDLEGSTFSPPPWHIIPWHIPARCPGRFGVGHDDAAVADAAGRQEELLRRLAPLRQVLLQLQRQRPPKTWWFKDVHIL